jgi:hypothetical protein
MRLAGCSALLLCSALPCSALLCGIQLACANPAHPIPAAALVPKPPRRPPGCLGWCGAFVMISCSKHRAHVDWDWRPKLPGQIEFGPTRTGPEHRRRPPQWHRHEARGRCSYYRNPYQAPLTNQLLLITKHTGGSCAPTHKGTGANGGSGWRLDRARGGGKAGARILFYNNFNIGAANIWLGNY